MLNTSCYIHTHAYTRVIKKFKIVYLYSSHLFLATRGETNSEFAISFLYFSQILLCFVIKTGTFRVVLMIAKALIKTCLLPRNEIGFRTSYSSSHLQKTLYSFVDLVGFSHRRQPWGFHCYHRTSGTRY